MSGAWMDKSRFYSKLKRSITDVSESQGDAIMSHLSDCPNCFPEIWIPTRLIGHKDSYNNKMVEQPRTQTHNIRKCPHSSTHVAILLLLVCRSLQLLLPTYRKGFPEILVFKKVALISENTY